MALCPNDIGIGAFQIMSDASANVGWAVFRIRDYSIFFVCRLLSGMAYMMNDVALGWLVYDRTHSPLALGMVGLTIFAPNILLVLVVGQVAERVDRRAILICSFALMSLSSACLAFVSESSIAAIWPIFMLVALNSVARAFANPASQAIVPTLVPREMFSTAVAISSSAYQTAIIAGPAIGGIAYIWGPGFVFSLTSLAFGVASLSMVLMQTRARQTPLAGPDAQGRTGFAARWHILTAGFRFIAGRPLVLGTISLDLFAVLLGGATALLPIYAADILHTGPMGLGTLRSMPAIGAFTMSIVLTHFPMNSKTGFRMFGAVGIFGAFTIVFGLSTSFWLSIPALIIMGCADMVSVYIRNTLVQMETPDDMRGRVSAVNTLFVGASNQLGEFESGVVASLIGPVGAVVAGGVGTLLIVALWMRFFPELRDRDKLVA